MEKKIRREEQAAEKSKIKKKAMYSTLGKKYAPMKKPIPKSSIPPATATKSKKQPPSKPTLAFDELDATESDFTGKLFERTSSPTHKVEDPIRIDSLMNTEFEPKLSTPELREEGPICITPPIIHQVYIHYIYILYIYIYI